MIEKIYYKPEVYKLLLNIVTVYNSIPNVTPLTETTIIEKVTVTYPEINKKGILSIATPAVIFDEITNEPVAWSEGVVTSRKIEYELLLLQKQESTKDNNYIAIEDLTDIIVKTMEYSGFKTLSIFPEYEEDSNLQQGTLTFLLADEAQLKEVVKNL